MRDSPVGRRESAWLMVAGLADDTGDTKLLDTALASILAYGDSTETAKIARANWGDAMASLAAVRPRSIREQMMLPRAKRLLTSASIPQHCETDTLSLVYHVSPSMSRCPCRQRH